MIHVQIASQLTAQGVSGVRWVLVEPVDAPLGAEPGAPADPIAPPAAAASPAPQTGSPAAGALQLGALKLAAVGLGLGAALWTAHVQVGPPDAPPTAPVAPAAPAPATPQALPAHQDSHGSPAGSAPPAQARPLPPATAPDRPAPPAPAASGGLPRLTASL